MNKKGLTFSIGFMVMLIMAILIFSMSLFLLFQWFGEAEELEAAIDKQTREQILSALKTGTSLVAIPFSIQPTSRGKPVNFGIGVRNIKEQRKFSTSVSFSGAYDPGGQEIIVDEDFIKEHWLGRFAKSGTFTLRRNEQQIMPLLIRAHTSIGTGTTRKGDYVFNVCVFEGTPADCTLGQINNVYTRKIYQVTVRVI